MSIYMSGSLAACLHAQVSELKMSMRSMGMFEGMLEAFSYLVRMFSGERSGVWSHACCHDASLCMRRPPGHSSMLWLACARVSGEGSGMHACS